MAHAELRYREDQRRAATRSPRRRAANSGARQPRFNRQLDRANHRRDVFSGAESTAIGPTNAAVDQVQSDSDGFFLEIYYTAFSSVVVIIDQSLVAGALEQRQ